MNARDDSPPPRRGPALDEPAPPPAAAPKRLPLPIDLNLPRRELLPEVDRLILNQTLSRAGADFYSLFVQRWGEPSKGGYLIVIKDSPARGRAVNLRIEVNGTELLNQTFFPSADYLESLATNATDFIVDYIENGRHLMASGDGEF